MEWLQPTVVTIAIFSLTQLAYLLWMLSKLTATVESHEKILEEMKHYHATSPQDIAVLKQQFTDMSSRLERIEYKLDRLYIKE